MVITYAKNIAVYKAGDKVIIYVDDKKMTVEQFNEWLKAL
jgi:hypothetical protein